MEKQKKNKTKKKNNRHCDPGLGLLFQPLLQTSTKGKSKIKEVHTSPGRSLGTTNVAQTDAGLYIKDKISQTEIYEVHKEQETEA